MKLRFCWPRRALMAGSSVGPSAPQFQLLLSLAPSWLFFAIGFVMLVIITDQIVQREAVVAGDKIDAGRGLPPVILIEVATAAQTGGKF